MSQYYNICPRCGATLDPGETCDCWEEEERLHRMRERIARNMREESETGQFAFAFAGQDDRYVGAGTF